MVDFISQVAEYLYQHKRSEFKESVLVFPNHRSIVYFKKSLRSISKTHIWEPKMQTISEFVNDFSSLKLAGALKLMSVLYKVYLEVAKSKESFDEFFAWGEMMLRDFDNVDKYMVNADAIFTNTKDYKNLSSAVDYLNEEQLEVIKRFFVEFEPDKSTDLKTTFLKTWDFLLPIYKEFKIRLGNEGFAYEGMMYREVEQVVSKMSADEAPFKQVYFIGFNAITRCEESVFESLSNLKLASFFWDYNSLYVDDRQMEAGLFLRKYLKKFPPLARFKDQQGFSKQEIKVIASPTDTGQVFQAASLLQNSSVGYEQTALVLSDELLLPTVLNYLPSAVDAVNITMGYPIKDSKTGLLINGLLELQKSSRVVDGNVTFYFKNALALLRHPFLMALYKQDVQALLDGVLEDNLFYIPSERLQINPLFTELFSVSASWVDFSSRLLSVLKLLQQEIVNSSNLVDELKMELEFLFNAQQQVSELKEELLTLNLEMALPTYFKILTRVLDGLKVVFEGEPLKGLQVMGFLETRNLDFEHLIVLSVSEGILPLSSVQASFIPYTLRKAFGLPVREQQDAMYAYYFYRVLQRAKKVSLLYNATASGLATGEKSRLINQLLYHPKFNVEKKDIGQTIEVLGKNTVVVEKKGAVKDKLQLYLEENSKRKLSPSALTTYLTCPLKFYYGSVLYLRAADEAEEKVDARIFGSIFHYAAENLYQPFYKNKELVTAKAIDDVLKSPKMLDALILKAFKDVVYGERVVRNFSLEGKNHLVFEVVKKYLIQLLRIDREQAPFSILGLETDVVKKQSFEAGGKSLTVNIGGQIDRLDRVNGGVRIIDYKTGQDRISFDYLDDVFSSEKVSSTKAIFQTFLYAMVYSGNHPEEMVVLPGVYQVKQFFQKGLDYSIVEKKGKDYSSGNFKQVEAKVIQGVNNVLAEIFDFSKPFLQTEDEKRCAYCDYKDMCGR